ncbi:MAG: hypothetical protein J3R72DRAFT_438080 [Linnemannia gamsii]|nr:MAG: hypothetical protein J3R72DRAFT_438080 [Linnemannia gamsii]
MRNLIMTAAPSHRNALHTFIYSSTSPPLQRSNILLSTITTTTPITCSNAKGRRLFITLPKLPQLPNLLKPLSSSRYYKDRTLLKYSQQEFYDLVANVDDYHKFLPWCTYSKMSSPLPLGSESGTKSGSGRAGSDVGVVKGGGEVTVRHGELGIGFNSLQERYVSTVTSQEPWMVRAVSYDSKLFKELSTTWRFTPNAPKTTTLEATMDQEVQETQLLTRPAAIRDEDEMEVVTPESAASSSGATTEKPSIPTEAAPTPTPTATIATPMKKQAPRHYFTAAAVFGEAALPRPKTNQTITPSSSPTSTLPSASSTTPSPNIPTGGQSASATESPVTSSDPTTTTAAPTPSAHSPTSSLRSSPPQQVILQRTASPSNLATMKPSDYPSCWIDFEIEFEFASPLHASMSSLFFDQVSKEMLAAFVKRAEVLYGQR